MKDDEARDKDRTERVEADEEEMIVESGEIPPEPPTAASIEPNQESELRPSLWAQLRAHLTRPPSLNREVKSVERTRGLVILVGTAIVCVFLFFGLFTTDSSTNRKERRVTPNLGRPEAATVDPESAVRSPVPQLSVNEQPNEDTGELSEQDLLGTMRNRGTPAPADAPPAPPAPPERTLRSVNFDDPALIEAYRRQGLVPPAPRQPVSTVTTSVEPQPRQTAVAAPVLSANPTDELRKSSIVFVRTAAQTGPAQASPVPALTRKATPLLPQGTALVARLQHSVSSAAKVPVTAVIEYNYEESGQLVVPAGTKAYGDLAQATPQGWVTIKFHTLEFPGGQQEEINGSAISMDRTALRGDVNGKNGAKKFLTRTLTGVGTIAAFAVGGRGLTGGVDNSILLRERLASNIALAGEQELAAMSYQQNIVVTVPANTRFYLVLNVAGVSRPPETAPQQASQQIASTTLQQTATRAALSDEEMRELIQLRNELREMNQLMQSSAPKLDPSASENR